MDEMNQKNEFEYIKERVKQRPLNRKKLMRRTIITAAMAMIFGVLACFTFLVLQPVFSNFLYPEEEPEVVEIPEDTNEMLPEDMILQEEPEVIIKEVTKEDDADPLSRYGDIYDRVAELADSIKPSVVTVRGVSQDVDWFDNEFENEGQTAGLYVANNNKELLILADVTVLSSAEQISVTFNDGYTMDATIKQQDFNTGLGIIAVDSEGIPNETMGKIVPATLGNSRVSSLLGKPVIAMGRPYANTESVALGMLVAKNMYSNLPDNNYEILMTDIYGSAEATGIIIDTNGNVIGIIEQSYNHTDTPNLICAIGVSDLKKTIERMSNGRERAYLGVIGTDVTDEVHDQLGVPKGAYVTRIEMGSPAMNYGIQGGDIIVKMGTMTISNYRELTDSITNATPESTVDITVLRSNGEGYAEMVLPIMLDRK